MVNGHVVINVLLETEQFEKGDEVEVFGKVVSENEISTCDDQKYYIKTVESSMTIDASTWQTYRNEAYDYSFDYPQSLKVEDLHEIQIETKRS